MNFPGRILWPRGRPLSNTILISNMWKNNWPIRFLGGGRIGKGNECVLSFVGPSNIVIYFCRLTQASPILSLLLTAKWIPFASLVLPREVTMLMSPYISNIFPSPCLGSKFLSRGISNFGWTVYSRGEEPGWNSSR